MPINHKQLKRLFAGTAVAAFGVSSIAVASASADTTPTTTPPIAPLTLLTGKTPQGRGDIFLTPTDASGTYAEGAEIASPTGKVVWFHRAPTGDVDADFRPQKLDGKRVLTFWEGTNFGGLSSGTDYIYNDHYKQIASVKAGDGWNTDGHEFLISPWGTAFVLSYGTTTANLTDIGGAADQSVVSVEAQEINIKTGKVLWSWNPANHLPYSISEEPLPTSASTPWDWFHINAIKVLNKHSVLIDSRDTWTAYKVSLRNGKVDWKLGGKDSSFTQKAAKGQSLNDAGDLFAWQHDAEQIGPNEYTIFDDESAGTANSGTDSLSDFAYSRVDTIKINPRTKTATLIATDNQPEQQLATSQGNAQPLPNGGEFVGWGDLNSFSEFSAKGKLVFNAEFPTGVNTYRAYLLPWSGAAANSHHHR
jgi:Arylsulfotransferase (ASST)